MLSQYPEIEQRHYKLWLSSTNVLKSILNNAIVGRSTFKLEEIKEFVSKYVLTKNHAKAIDILNSLHTVIITGEPGIGKTTLADHLCLFHVLNDFELFYIEDSISEAESVINPKKKQIFYFDDFLGRNFFQALNRHEDSHIINFIKRISKDNSKRFILTSRTTILNQGKRLSDLYNIENLHRNEFEIRITSLSNLEKAKILYNHIWFSALNEEFIEELYYEKRYKKIITHQNFNPRLVAFITDSYKIADINYNEYWPYITNTLKNPADIWAHLFENQIDELSRLIVCLVVYNGRKISEHQLKEAIAELINNNFVNKPVGLIDVESCLKIIVGSIVNRSIVQGGLVIYDLFNPSVGDFILKKYSGNSAALSNIMHSLNTIESLKNLKNLIKNKVLPKVTVQEIIQRLVKEKIGKRETSSSFDYKIILSNIALNETDDCSEIKEAICRFLENFHVEEFQTNYVPDLIQLFQWGIQETLFKKNDLTLKKFLEKIIEEPLEHEDLLAISKLLKDLEITSNDTLYKNIKDNIIAFWVDSIEVDIAQTGKLNEYYEDEDEDEVYKKFHEHVINKLAEYNIQFEEEKIEEILNRCDPTEIIENNRENTMDGDNEYDGWKDERYSSLSEDEAIDDLFDRNNR